MIKNTLKYALFFVLFYLLQVYVFDNLPILLPGVGFTRVFIIHYFILILPFMPSWQLMLIGFFLGLMVDISYGFLGVNAAGLVLIGFLRNDVLYTIAQKSPDESVVYPHLSYLRWGKFIRYVTFTSVIFLTFTSILSTFSWHLFVDMLINTLINIGLSILVIMAIDILLFSTEAKEEGFSRV